MIGLVYFIYKIGGRDWFLNADEQEKQRVAAFNRIADALEKIGDNLTR